MTITECIILLMDNTTIYNTITKQPFYTDNCIIVYGNGIELYIPIEYIYNNKWYRRNKDIKTIVVDYITGHSILDILKTIKDNNNNVTVDYNKDDKGFIQVTFE